MEGQHIRENVIDLDSSILDATIQDSEYIYIYFKGPKHGRCGNPSVNFYREAKVMSELGSQVKFARIICESNMEACAKYGVTENTYGSFRLFNKGQLIKVPMDAHYNFLGWLRKLTEPVSKYLPTQQDAENLINNTLITGIFFGSSTSEAFSSFLTSATTMKDVFFGHTDKQDLIDKYQATEQTMTAFRTAYRRSQPAYIRNYTVEDLQIFTRTEEKPLVYSFRQSFLIERSQSERKPNLIYLILDNTQDNMQIENIFKTVATTFKDKLEFVLVNFNDTDERRFTEEIGVLREHLPAIRISSKPFANRFKHAYTGKVTTKSLTQFLQDHIDDKLECYYISEPLPAQNIEDGVEVIVGKTCDEIMTDNNNNVLIFFYRDDSQEDLDQLQRFSELVKKLGRVSGVRFAKMNIARNEASKASKYSQFLWYPKKKDYTNVQNASKLLADDKSLLKCAQTGYP